MRLDQLGILDVWAGLGGGELRHNRGRAFWRDGNAYSISLNTAKNQWYDFRDALGGGVLSLVETAQGCNRASALTWLEQNCGLDPRRPLSPREKRESLAQAAGTERLAQRLADFASGLELITEKTVMGLDEYLCAAGIEAPETIGQLQHQLFVLKTAHPQDIAHLWRNARTMAAEVERVGREHREYSEKVTQMIVDMLTCVSATEMAA